MSIKDVLPNILSGVVGAILGAILGAVATWNKDRIAARQNIMEFLRVKRQQLDDNPELLRVVGLLKQELHATKNNQPVPDQGGIPGYKLRDLPAFLEPIGTFLEYNPATFHKAYGYFAEEVLLCDQSSLIWKDSGRYEDSVYWRSFGRFVKHTKKRGYKL